MTKVKSLWLFLCCWGIVSSSILAQEQKDSLTNGNSAVAISEVGHHVAPNPEDLMKEAIVHFDGGRYAKSIELLDEAIKVNKFEQLTDILYYYRAISKTKINQYSEALADYSKAIETNPYKSKYFYHRGLTYFQIGNYEQAKNDFTTTLSMDGENADIYVKLGFLKQQENDLKGAIEDYTKAITFNSKLGDAYYYRGLIYLQVLLPEKACTDLQKATDLGHPLALRHYDKYCDN